MKAIIVLLIVGLLAAGANAALTTKQSYEGSLQKVSTKMQKAEADAGI
jgi:uncharacterized protein YceK